MNTDDFGVNRMSGRVVGCAFRAGNALGAGFLEWVYKNALLHELREARHMMVQQHRIVLFYDAAVVRQYAVDLLAEETIMVKLKAVKALDAQCIS